MLRYHLKPLTIGQERDFNDAEALQQFLEDLSALDTTKAKQSLEATQGTSENLADHHSDLCGTCRLTIEEECAKHNEKRWHLNCLICANCKKALKGALSEGHWSETERRLLCQECAEQVPDAQGGFERITRLKQYVFLLRVALARLLVMLRQGGTLPHTSGMPSTPIKCNFPGSNTI